MNPLERAVAANAAQRTGVPVPHPEQVPIGIQLGIGPNWQPAPGGWRWSKLRSTDGTPVHVLILDTVAGSCGLAMSPDDLRRFLATGQEELSGIVVPEVKL